MSYTKQTWANGDIITAAKLNHIEDGIEAVETELSGSIEAVETDLDENYAKADGYYEALTAGNAEQLISSVTENDKVPYNFRTSGGSIDIGDRETDMLVGGTIAWNQQFKEVTSANWIYTDASLGEATFSNGECAYTTLSDSTSYRNGIRSKQGTLGVVGHKYLIYTEAKASRDGIAIGGDICNVGFTFTGSLTSSYQAFAKIVSCTARQEAFFCMRGGHQANDVVTFKNLMLIDLTQMFGSAIADYIIALETATTGAGVAFFRKLFPKPYYAYDAGSLQSVKASAHKTVGFNAWDEERESGDMDANGQKSGTSSSAMRSVNMIPVVPSSTYCFTYGGDWTAPSKSIGVYEYDGSGNFIKSTFKYVAQFTFTPTADTHFIMFRIYISTATALSQFGTVCLNLSWDGERDGEYEAYVQHTYPLDSDLELRGIPKLDANNSLYYDGDEYASDGTVTRKYGIRVLNGTESWAGTPGSGWYTDANDMKKYSSYIGHMMADKLFAPYAEEGGIYGYNDAGNAYPAQNWIYYRNSSMERPADVKAYFAANPVAVIYELAEPTTESADPYQNPQIVDDFGTEEYVDTRAVAIPVGHDTNYQANLRAKLEMAPVSPDSNGDYIVRHNNGENSYVPITFPADELPAAPTEDGNYVLKCTVADGTATFTWASAT